MKYLNLHLLYAPLKLVEPLANLFGRLRGHNRTSARAMAHEALHGTDIWGAIYLCYSRGAHHDAMARVRAEYAVRNLPHDWAEQEGRTTHEVRALLRDCGV